MTVFRLTAMTWIIWTGLGLMGCRNPGNQTAASTPASGQLDGTQTPEPVPVIVESVLQGTIAAYIETTSNIFAESHVVVYPKASGQIEEVRVQEGDRVIKGDILAVIDDDECQLRVKQASVARQQAEEKHDRIKNMFESRMASQESWHDAQYAFQEAYVAWELTDLELRNTRIHSPITGIIVKRSINRGDRVSTSTPTFEVVDPGSLMIDVHLPEREAMRLRKGMPADIMPDSLPDSGIPGFVDRINPAVDPKTGTVKISLGFHDHNSPINTGMFARVRIKVEQRENAILVPKRAVLRRRDESWVYIMNSDSRAEKRPIQLGLENSEHFEVVTGVEPGDSLIVVGQHNLEEGQAVRLLESRS
ncbi:efflux RND transporter periplasmic adaptor subunit [bacterium]|nr:efflux RND transporter periplasmic adaptor subunit [candidate division CSSED10-310 bacterium]